VLKRKVACGARPKRAGRSAANPAPGGEAWRRKIHKRNMELLDPDPGRARSVLVRGVEKSTPPAATSSHSPTVDSPGITRRDKRRPPHPYLGPDRFASLPSRPKGTTIELTER